MKNNIRNNLRILITIFLFSLLSKICLGTSFVAIGHLYPVIKDDEIISRLFKKIESLNPDYIFVLGDSALEDKETFLKFKNKFKDKIFFSPGNHEIINNSLDQYVDNVGYLIYYEQFPLLFHG